MLVRDSRQCRSNMLAEKYCVNHHDNTACALFNCRVSSRNFDMTHHKGPVLEKSRAHTTGADHIQSDYDPEASNSIRS